MGTVTIGVNSVSGGFGHAYVDVRLENGLSLQIHGEPLGNAVFGGILSAFTDFNPINVEFRQGDGKVEPVSSYVLASDVPDSVLSQFYADVLEDAQAHFSGAQYEIPSLNMGNLTFNPDNGYWKIQNSNSVANWVSSEFASRLQALGYQVSVILDPLSLSPNHPLAGWHADTANLRATFELGSVFRSVVDKISDIFGEIMPSVVDGINNFFPALKEALGSPDGHFTGWASDGYICHLEGTDTYVDAVETEWRGGCWRRLWPRGGGTCWWLRTIAACRRVSFTPLLCPDATLSLFYGIGRGSPIKNLSRNVNELAIQGQGRSPETINLVAFHDASHFMHNL